MGVANGTVHEMTPAKRTKMTWRYYVAVRSGNIQMLSLYVLGPQIYTTHTETGRVT